MSALGVPQSQSTSSPCLPAPQTERLSPPCGRLRVGLLAVQPRRVVHLGSRAEAGLRGGAGSNPPHQPAGNCLGTGGSLLSAEMRGHAKLLHWFLPDSVLQNQIKTISLTPDISKMDPPSRALAHSILPHTEQPSGNPKSRHACPLPQLLLGGYKALPLPTPHLEGLQCSGQTQEAGTPG